MMLRHAGAASRRATERSARAEEKQREEAAAAAAAAREWVRESGCYCATTSTSSSLVLVTTSPRRREQQRRAAAGSLRRYGHHDPVTQSEATRRPRRTRSRGSARGAHYKTCIILDLKNYYVVLCIVGSYACVVKSGSECSVDSKKIPLRPMC